MHYFLLFVLYATLQFHTIPGNAQNISKTEEKTPLDDTDYDYDSNYEPYALERFDTFDWMLLKKILAEGKSNVIISPFSIKICLALLAEAAGNQSLTQQELVKVLANGSNRTYIKTTLDSLKEKSADYDLNLGTKLYVDESIEPRQRFASIIHSYYDTEIEKISFSNVDQSIEIINNWCTNITNGHLKNLVSADDFQNPAMLILNVIHFDGKWKFPFNISDTRDMEFFTQPDSAVNASFMKQISSFYYYESTKLNAKLLRLPYNGKKFSMTIVLPDTNEDFDKFIKEMDSGDYKRLQWLMTESEVKVTLPKLKFDYNNHLKEILQQLGINELFTPNAALPGLARGQDNVQRYVSHVIQKAGLIVDEEGTIASAATHAGVVNKIGGNKKEFNANHPFIFFIEDETTGSILFAGKVVDPTV